MTPHYDLKQQEKTMVFWGLGWGGGHKYFVIYLGWGVEYVFLTGLGGGGVVKMFAYHMKM